MKTLIFALGLIALCSAQAFWHSTPFLRTPEEAPALDAKESLQLIFDGLWEQGGLNDPKNIINCFNEDSAKESLDFIGGVLANIARGNAIVLTKIVVEYEKHISPSTAYCFGNDTELTDLKVAYKLSNYTVPQLYVAIYKYILLHIKDLETSAAGADFYFDQGNFKQTGIVIGQIIQSVVNGTNATEPTLDAKESLQLIFDGLWEQGGLNDPKNIINCFNEDSARETLDFIGKMLANIARGNAVILTEIVVEYEKHISSSTAYCFGNDTELTDLKVAYKLSNYTTPQLYVAIYKYILLHVKDLETSAAAADFYFDQENFKQSGIVIGQIVQSVVNNTNATVIEEVAEEVQMPGLDPKESLQLIFDGLWEQGGLNDPKNIINCFNEQSANETLNFIGAMLTDIARGNALVIPKTVLAYEKTISPSCVYCFGNDTELTDLKIAYKLSNYTTPQLYVAIYEYILLHIKDLTNFAASADFDFTQGQYKQVGTIFGQVTQSVVNKSSATNDDPLSDLQSLLNGLFEQAGLQDPKNLVQCFNETSAQITLDFFGDVINDLAKDDYLSLVREYHVYASSIPKNVSDCVKNDPEATAVYNAYGFDNETGKSLLQKYLTFGIKHHLQLLNDTKTINQDVANNDYTDAGKVTGVLIQAIIGGQDLISEQQIADGLEDVIQDMILNGY